MSLVITHNTPADGTFSDAGAAAWNANHSLSGTADVTQGGGSNEHLKPFEEFRKRLRWIDEQNKLQKEKRALKKKIVKIESKKKKTEKQIERAPDNLPVLV